MSVCLLLEMISALCERKKGSMNEIIRITLKAVEEDDGDDNEEDRVAARSPEVGVSGQRMGRMATMTGFFLFAFEVMCLLQTIR